MMGLPPHISGWILKGLCAALGAAAVAETVLITPWASSTGPQPIGNVVEDIDSLAPARIDASIASILDRPLFLSSRFAEYNESDEDEDDTSSFPRRLSGIAIKPDGREALFQMNGEKAVAVKLNGKIDNWTVTAIENDHVIVKGRSGTETLRLTKGIGPAAVARPKRNNVKPSGNPAGQRRTSVVNARQATR